MNRVFFELLHSRALRLHGYDPYLERGPDNPVLPLPVISSFTASPATITSDVGSVSTLRWTVAGATSVSIDQGVGDVTPVLGVNVKPGSTTTYTLVATNASGSVRRSVRVSVGATLEPVVADAVADNLSPAAGQTVQFTGNATGGTGGYSYAWSFSDGQGATTTRTTSRSFAAAGTYAATLTVTSGGVTATDTVEISVSAAGSAPVVTVSHSPANPLVGEEVTYTARVTGGTVPYSYAWGFGDGTDGGTASTAKKTYIQTGTKGTTLVVTGGGLSTTATYRISVGAAAPVPDDGEFAFLEADPNFDPARDYPDALTRNMAKAFIGVMSNPELLLRPELEADDVLSASRTSMVDMYRVRGPKILVNIVRGVLSHKRDPRFVALLLPFVKKVVDNLETEWTTYPYDDTPGRVDARGRVIDRHASDFGETCWNGKTGKESNGGDDSVKGAYKRWVAWGKSTSRQSPDYRDLRSTKERPRYKKILYLAAFADSTGIARYGTHLHSLDNMMAHATLGWACYILDVNRALSDEYLVYGQLGYDYIFNHWLPLTEETLAARRPAKRASEPAAENAEGVMNLRTALTHNVAAHAGVYALLTLWKEFRREAVNPKDVTALGNPKGVRMRCSDARKSR